MHVAFVGAQLAVHQLEQVRSTLKLDIERLKREKQELNSENENISRSEIEIDDVM